LASFLKSTMHRDPKLLKLARDQSCVSCGANDGTVVWAHSNLLEHGKGRSLKAHDAMGMLLCSICHHQLDQGFMWTREEKREYTYKWICATHLRLWSDGFIGVK